MIDEFSIFDVINEGLRVMWNPDDESITKCAEFGKQIAFRVINTQPEPLFQSWDTSLSL